MLHSNSIAISKSVRREQTLTLFVSAAQKTMDNGTLGQINDPCPSSTSATRSLSLVDCCVNGSSCWRWTFDEGHTPKAPGPSPPLHHVYCNNQGRWSSGAFPFHDGYVAATPCNPSANAIPFVYCSLFLILQCNISHPAQPIL